MLVILEDYVMFDVQDRFSDVALSIVSLIHDPETKFIYAETAHFMSMVDQDTALTGYQKKLHVLSAMKKTIAESQLDWGVWETKLSQFIDHLKTIHYTTLAILD